MLEFYVDVENNLGVKQGAGPLTSVRTWTYTARMDAAGDFSCTFAATDPVADEVVVKCVLRAWANLNGVWTEVGAGIVDNIERRVRPDGTVIMTASGQDLIRELTYRSVKNLALENSGAPVAHSVAVAAVAAYAPSGWTITADSSPAWDSIYGRFNGESMLAALLSVADKSRNHFTRGTGRSVEFASTFSDSGIRAIQAGPDDLVAETCAIANLSVRHESYDLLTRIYPRGSGNGDVQLTLRNTTRSAPSGYTLDKVNNYLQHDAGFATYGLIESWLDYREIGPVSNSNADLQAAADMLFDVTLRELQRRNEEAAASYYDIHLAQCSTLLRPMQTMHLVYQDAESGLDVDTDLNILEATWSVDVTGVQTTSVIVSNVDRWPQSDVDAIVNSMTQGHVYQALPQLNANSYVTAYTKNLDKTPTQDNYAQFRFRFGEEVVQLQQVLFEFQLLPFESTVRAVGGLSSGSGDLVTIGPSVADSGNPSNDTSGAASGDTGAASGDTGNPSTDTSGLPSNNTSGTAAGNTGEAAGNTGGPSDNVSGGPSAASSGTPSNNTSGEASGNTGASTGNTGNPSTNTTSMATGNTGASTGDTGIPSNDTSGQAIGNTGQATGNTGTASGDTGAATGNTGDSGTLITDGPDGTTIDNNGDHQHTFIISVNGTVTYPIGFAAGGSAGGLVTTLTGANDINFPVNLRGDHTHDLGNHTHDLASHSHSLNNHTHSLNDHTHSLGFHTHSLGSHTHTLSNHTHDLGSHTHDLGNHSHSLSNHTHNLGSHTHSLNSHTHTLSSHTHSLVNHTHSLANHTHSLNNHTHGLNSHTHSLGSHTHTLSNHTHDLGSHTHDLGNHTHSLNDHTHDLSESIVAIYGIFREVAGNTYGIADLEYRINSLAWQNLDTATSLPGDWYELDLTSQLVSTSIIGRPNQANNVLEIRAKTSGKTVTVDAQLTVRNIIQAIAYA